MNVKLPEGHQEKNGDSTIKKRDKPYIYIYTYIGWLVKCWFFNRNQQEYLLTNQYKWMGLEYFSWLSCFQGLGMFTKDV